MEMVDKIFHFLGKREVYGLILTIVIGYAVYCILSKMVQRLIHRGKTELERKKRKTVVKLIENIIRYIVFIFMFLIILDLYGVDTKSLIAGLGVAGVIVGLAFQDLVKDFISGLAIIMDNYYIVGDYIRYKDFTGEIIALGLKSTKVKNASGEVLTIANRNITEVVNLSQKEAKVTISIPTAYEEKIEKVEKTIEKIIKKIKTLENVNDCKYLGIDSLADSSVNYIIRVFCKQESQWDVKRASLRIIKKQYDEDDIKIPYPQVEVHNGKKI